MNPEQSHRFDVVGRHPQTGENVTLILWRERSVVVLSLNSTWRCCLALDQEQATEMAAAVVAAAG